MAVVREITFSTDGEIVLVFDSGETRTYTPETYTVDGAFQPELPTMALSVAVASLYDKLADLERRMGEVE